MISLLFMLLALALMFGPIYVTIKWCRRRLRGQTGWPVPIITLSMMITEVISSAIATIIIMWNLSQAGTKCLSGAAGLIGLGIILAISVIPLIGVYYGWKEWRVIKE